jgi:hypothetical protein
MVADAPVETIADMAQIAAMTKVARTRMTPTPNPLIAASPFKQLTIAIGSPKLTP